jgi:hypothetical protein
LVDPVTGANVHKVKSRKYYIGNESKTAHQVDAWKWQSNEVFQLQVQLFQRRRHSQYVHNIRNINIIHAEHIIIMYTRNTHE